MKTSDRDRTRLPTCTVTPARVRLFQPTREPTRRTRETTRTPWGSCTVSGRLGQRHADVLDAILFNAEASKTNAAGTLSVLIDPALVRRALSDGWYSLGRIKRLLTELREASIEIDADALRGQRWIVGGIVDRFMQASVTRPDPLHGGERHLWTVVLSPTYVFLLRYDLCLHRDPAPVARLRYGVSQAVARYLLTHSATRQPRGGWKLDNAIDAVCGQITGSAMRKARARVRADDAALAACGVQVDGDRLFLSPAAQTPAAAPGTQLVAQATCHSGPMACHGGPMACHGGPERATAARGL